MPPPQLATNTPILNVGQPVIVGVLIFSRVELDFVVHNWRQSQVSKVLHAQIPLHAQARFNSRIGITFAITYLIVVVFYLFKKSSFCKILCNLLTNCHAILTNIHACSLRKRTVCVEDVDRFKIVLLTQSVVIDIVGWGNFQTTGTKFYIYIAVFNHRDYSVYERHAYLLTFEPSVLGVLRVNAHGCVTHDGFRTGSSHDCIATVGIFVNNFAFNTSCIAIVVNNVILKIVKLALLLTINHFLVRKCSLGLRIPVYHAEATIDKALVIEIYKDFNDTL